MSRFLRETDLQTVHSKRAFRWSRGWHDFVYEVDLKNGIYSFWMDGIQIADQFDFTKDISSVNALRIDMVNRESPGKNRFSYFEVSQSYTYPYFTGGEFEGGLSAKTLKLQLERRLTLCFSSNRRRAIL